MKIIRCKFSGRKGIAAKSHIIPKALTKSGKPSAGFLQFGHGTRPKRRRTSWYDESSFISETEKLFSEIDDKGIKTLRKLGLVWSSRGIDALTPSSQDIGLNNFSLETHELRQDEALVLRRLFLSIAARASLSNLSELYEARLPKTFESRVVKLVSQPASGAWFNCPITLIRLTGNTPPLNQSPYLDTKEIIYSGKKIRKKFLRLYMDGLVAHLNLSHTARDAQGMGSLAIGHSSTLQVLSRPFEGSLQEQNLRSALNQT